MKLIGPVDISENSLVSSNVIEELPLASAGTSYNTWSNVTSYSAGNQVCLVGPNGFLGVGSSGTTFNIWSAIYTNTNLKPGYITDPGSGVLPGYWAWTLIRSVQAYSATATYGKGTLVGYVNGATGAIYQGLVDSNTGNTPSSSPTQWRQTGATYDTYSAGTTYASGARTCVFYGTRGLLFESLQGSNTGNNPETSPTWWGYKGETFKTWDAAASYTTGDVVISLATHREYEALQSNSNKDPTSDANVAFWLDRGATNKWRMFDLSNTSQSEFSDVIDVSVYVPDLIDSVALMNTSAREMWISATAVNAVNRNVIIWTQDFTNATWGKLACSVTGNATVAPDGTTTADKIILDSTSNYHYIEDAGPVIASTSQQWVYSIYCKAGELSKIRMSVYAVGATDVQFDLAAKTVGTITLSGGNPSPFLTSIDDVGGGWRRCTIGMTFGASSVGSAVNVIFLLRNNAGAEPFLGDGVSGVYIWGAQLENGSSVTPYQRVDATYQNLEMPYAHYFDLTDPAGITDWHAYYFEEINSKGDLAVIDMPMYTGMTIRAIAKSAGEMVKVGTFVAGKSVDLGGTLYGAKTGINDYSRIEADDFGRYEIVERGFSKRATFRLRIARSQVDQLSSILSGYRATPAVYYGATQYLSTLVFGFAKSWDVEISYPETSYISIEVEGLT